MSVVFTDEAEKDLEQIVDYIARDNLVRALSFARELVERCERLVEMPHAFPLVPRYEHAGVRRRVHSGYLIFYKADSAGIKILRILNGSQDYEAILFPSP